jgi:hypothetical protein
MKVAPFLAQLRERRQVRQVLVHTAPAPEVRVCGCAVSGCFRQGGNSLEGGR